MIDHRTAESLMAAAIDFPLSPDEQTALDAHLAGCDQCRTVGAQLRRHSLVLGEMATEGAPMRIRSVVEAAALQAGATNQRLMLLLAAALLAAAAIGGAVIVGSGLLDLDDLSINPSLPSPSAAPSDAPALPPTLPTSGFAQVKVSELSVRTEPQASAAQVGTLQEGDVVSILEGQTAADGQVWYRVRLGELTGWATARDSSTEWIGELPEPSSAWVLRVQRQYPTGALNDMTVVLYPDGRLVSPGLSVVSPGPVWEQRRLTREGTRLFVQEAVNTGLLEASAAYETEPPGYEGGYVHWSISVVAEQGPVTVTARTSSAAPEAAGIVALAERLTALAVDPPTAWLVDPDRGPAAYEPLTYDLVVTPRVGPPSDFGPMGLLGDTDVDTVDLPLPTSVLDIGEEVLDEPVPAGVRCASLTRDEARALREAFYALGLDRGEQDASVVFVQLPWAAQSGVVQLVLRAVPPGVESCVNVLGGTG